MITTRVSRPEIALAVREPIVALRTWLVAPEHLPRGRTQPVLTGIYGYRWRVPDLDARCTARHASHHTFGLPPHPDSYHPALPDPSCSCGIYAVRSEADLPPSFRTPAGVPVVSGFVALSGRVLTGPRTLRGQHAAIIGPLTLLPGRPPPVASILRRPVRPQSVVERSDGFRVRWSTHTDPGGWMTWAGATARLLEDRYRVEILVAPFPTR